LSSDSGAPTGLSEVRWTRTTVGGPNYLGGSVTTGEKKMFTSYVKNKDSQDSIIFGDGNQGKVKGLGKIAISFEHSISNVFLVESLGYNLLSIGQLCNM
jgi:hypothetical protein